ncbi:hypothetical protein C1878_15455 [Gordonibacter sp. 28C]|uniref:TetR/AcrR family transcriptional regulator n=1 Tax=Gordonibacter sp. 28C TaxID=2078569 RepID=UPI000DF725C5|nr:TetR/AcrR family transcriptional regulator [Gordonibacter sp. 28C]RDB59297.1 hypothetical protein C1878_15455 [Gordonibacter sp. 28C]
MDNVKYVFLPAKEQTKFAILRGIDRPIEEITVSQICKNCHISRPTFYTHFDSKYAIASWLFDLAAELYLIQIGRSLKWDTGVRGYFSLLYSEKRHLRYAFSNTPNKPSVELQLEHRRDEFIKTLRDYKHLSIDDDLRFYAQYFAFSGNRFVVDWCLENMPTPPDLTTRYFTECMPTPLIEALDRDTIELTYD